MGVVLPSHRPDDQHCPVSETHYCDPDNVVYNRMPNLTPKVMPDLILTHYAFFRGYAVSKRVPTDHMYWSEPLRWPDDSIWVYIPTTWQPVCDETT